MYVLCIPLQTINPLLHPYTTSAIESHHLKGFYTHIRKLSFVNRCLVHVDLLFRTTKRMLLRLHVQRYVYAAYAYKNRVNGTWCVMNNVDVNQKR